MLRSSTPLRVLCPPGRPVTSGGGRDSKPKTPKARPVEKLEKEVQCDQPLKLVSLCDDDKKKIVDIIEELTSCAEQNALLQKEVGERNEKVEKLEACLARQRVELNQQNSEFYAELAKHRDEVEHVKAEFVMKVRAASQIKKRLEEELQAAKANADQLQNKLHNVIADKLALSAELKAARQQLAQVQGQNRKSVTTQTQCDSQPRSQLIGSFPVNTSSSQSGVADQSDLESEVRELSISYRQLTKTSIDAERILRNVRGPTRRKMLQVELEEDAILEDLFYSHVNKELTPMLLFSSRHSSTNQSLTEPFLS